jgi:AcrR family transcriptional regulator
MVQTSPRRKARRAYHHGDLRNALLAAACALLERDGAAALSFRAIARAVGVSQAAPYHHFPDKEHLLAAVATLGFDELRECQTAAAEGGTPQARLRALCRAYVRFACQNPNMYRLMFGEVIADWRKHPRAASAKRRCFEPAQAVIAADPGVREGQSPQAAESVGIAAWALAHGLAMLIIDGTLQGELSAAELGHGPIAGILRAPAGASEPERPDYLIQLLRLFGPAQ